MVLNIKAHAKKNEETRCSVFKQADTPRNTGKVQNTKRANMLNTTGNIKVQNQESIKCIQKNRYIRG